MTACTECAAGPKGIEGHERLFVHTMDRGQMQFKCQACECIWLRRYGGQGTFEWELSIALVKGAALPGR